MKISDLEYFDSLSDCDSIDGGAFAYASSSSISSSDGFSGSSVELLAIGESGTLNLSYLSSSSISYRGFYRGFASSYSFSYAVD